MFMTLSKVFMVCAGRCAAPVLTNAVENAILAIILGHEACQKCSQNDQFKDAYSKVLKVSRKFIVPILILRFLRNARKIIKASPFKKRDELAITQAPIEPTTPIAPPRPKAPSYPTLPLPPPPGQIDSPLWVDQHYGEWVGLMKGVLARLGDFPFPHDFDIDGLQMARFLHSAGICKVKNAPDAARCVEHAAEQLRVVLATWKRENWMHASELERWDEVVWWEGPDEDGYMWLCIHAARAVLGGHRKECGQAVLTQMEYGTRHICAAIVANPPPAPSVSSPTLHHSIKVAIYVCGVRTAAALRCFGLMRTVALRLNRHYPCRLQDLYMVDVPLPVRWMAEIVLSCLPSSTRHKIKICSRVDLPERHTHPGICISTPEHAWGPHPPRPVPHHPNPTEGGARPSARVRAKRASTSGSSGDKVSTALVSLPLLIVALAVFLLFLFQQRWGHLEQPLVSRLKS